MQRDLTAIRAKEKRAEILKALHELGGNAPAGKIAERVGVSLRCAVLGLDMLNNLGLVLSTHVPNNKRTMRPAWGLSPWVESEIATWDESVNIDAKFEEFISLTQLRQGIKTYHISELQQGETA